MLLDRLRSTKVAIPVGMVLVLSGLSLVLISTALPHLSPRFAQPMNLGDFLHGFVIGVGIALEIGGLIVMLPAALAAREQRRANSGK